MNARFNFILLLTILMLVIGCSPPGDVSLSAKPHNVIPHILADLGLALNTTTNRLDCRWDKKQERNGVYYYIENQQENWQRIADLLAVLYSATPRTHSDVGQTNESMFYGAGRVKAMTGLMRSCSEHGGESTNSFCVVISKIAAKQP